MLRDVALGEYLPIGTDGPTDQPLLGRASDSGSMLDTSSRPYVPPNIPQAPTDTALIAGPSPAPLAPVAAPASASAKTSAGVGLLLLGLATAGGAYAGGAYGAGAGLLLMGATRNVLRAKKLWASPVGSEHDEAIKSGTMALFGLGIGGWLAYKAYDERYGYEDEEDA